MRMFSKPSCGITSSSLSREHRCTRWLKRLRKQVRARWIQRTMLINSTSRTSKSPTSASASRTWVTPGTYSTFITTMRQGRSSSIPPRRTLRGKAAAESPSKSRLKGPRTLIRSRRQRRSSSSIERSLRRNRRTGLALIPRRSPLKRTLGLRASTKEPRAANGPPLEPSSTPTSRSEPWTTWKPSSRSTTSQPATDSWSTTCSAAA